MLRMGWRTFFPVVLLCVMCKGGVARKVQYAATERAHKALQQMFKVYRAELERVEVFKYLGRLLAYGVVQAWVRHFVTSLTSS